MNPNNFLPKITFVFALVLGLTAIVQTSRASVDIYLKIDGRDGDAAKVHKIVRCTDGSCSLGRLPVGTYKVSVCWVQGGKTAMDDWSAITKAAASSTGAPASSSITITSNPKKDAAMAAMPTGRRMHKPLSIIKTVDKSSPAIFSIAAADVDGDGMLDVTITCRKAGTGGN